MPEKKTLLYQGKAKKLYATDQEDILWVEYTDQATALNGLKKDQITGKAELTNKISSQIFTWLAAQGIPNHLVEILSPTEQLVRAVKIVPLEVVVRNVSAGSLAKRLGWEEGVDLDGPIVEFYYKNDELGDPLLADAHLGILELATEMELATIRLLALQINQSLIELFKQCGIRLVDFKLEFGRDKDGQLLLADEISPDTCRLWDAETGNHMDKDVYRRDLGDIIPVYEQVLNRLRDVNA